MEQDVRQRILLAAKQLFAEQGYDGTTIRQICDKAGANISLVSYYFGGKEKVLQHIFEAFFPGARLNALDERFRDPLQGLLLLIDQIIAFSFDDVELSRIISQELQLETPRTDIVLSFVKPVWTMLEELLQRGKEQGIFHFESLAHTSLFIRGIALTYKNNRQAKSLSPAIMEDEAEQMKKTATQFILNGLKVATAP